MRGKSKWSANQFQYTEANTRIEFGWQQLTTESAESSVVKNNTLRA